MRRFPILSSVLVLACCGSVQNAATFAQAIVPTAKAAPGDICAALMPETSLAQPPAITDNGDGVIRFLAFGDFGEQPDRDTEPQKKLAQAMSAYHTEHPFDFGLVLGDNFYPVGLDTTTDPRWKSQWEDLYSPMGIRFYAVLGNHDYYDKKKASKDAEMQYSSKSATWCLPRFRYTFSAGPVQLFAIDTTPVDEPKYDSQGMAAAQKEWLAKALAANRTTKWKIVYGHHPIYSNGQHGKDEGNGTLPPIKEYLLPVLTAGAADVYLAGHDHDLQALEPEKGVHFYVSGAAGRALRDVELSHCKLFGQGRKEKAYGFAVLEAKADGSSLTVSFVGMDSKKPYRVLWGPVEIQKGASSDCRPKK